MPVMTRLRAYHAVLAVLVLAAYFSTEWGAVHAWLGYGVAVVILVRVVMALTGAPQLGLMRFYPQIHGLKLDNAFTHPAISRVLLLGIAACLIGVTATGIAMDRGRALKPASIDTTAPAVAQGDRRGEREGGEEDEDGEESPFGEIHELFGNGLMLLVAGHVTYLLLFKRPLARFMILGAPKSPPK
ncbi:cytochrome b/b6 domain-containing protein [Caulobacter sp. 1776]|uniref:cytochrome b/b6 domain-containing protein n=1 Tax=Caulobacter sp. 1776 TaxID=3156420 RepID=UPI003395CECA